MSRSIKKTASWSDALVKVASAPHNLFSGLRYRLHGWQTKPLKTAPETILSSTFLDEFAGDSNFKTLSFTFSIIALTAKVAVVDGQMTQGKYVAFREAFPLSGEECGKIRSLFTLACTNKTPFEHYISLIKHAFPKQPQLYNAIMERLFRVATVEGPLTRTAEKFLSTIAHLLGVSAWDYGNIAILYNRPTAARTDNKHAQHILGVQADVQANALKKRYHELMQLYHPDRYAAQDLSPEIRMLLQLKTSEINAAYTALSKMAA